MKTISMISIFILNTSLAFAAANNTPTASQKPNTPKSCTLNGAPFSTGSVSEVQTANNKIAMHLSTAWPPIKLQQGTQSQAKVQTTATTQSQSATASSGSNSIPGFTHDVVAYFKNADGTPATIQEQNLTQTVNGNVVTVSSKVGPNQEEQNQIVVTLNADHSMQKVQLSQTVGSQINHNMTCTF